MSLLNSIVCPNPKKLRKLADFRCDIYITVVQNISPFNKFLYNYNAKKQINSVLIIINVLNKGETMNKLTKLLFSAISSVAIATSAFAGEFAVTTMVLRQLTLF